MPLDPIDESTTVQFVKGSHRWGKWFHPRYFATESNYECIEELTDDRVYHQVPVDEIAAGKWDIIKWAVKVSLVSLSK